MAKAMQRITEELKLLELKWLFIITKIMKPKKKSLSTESDYVGRVQMTYYLPTILPSNTF